MSQDVKGGNLVARMEAKGRIIREDGTIQEIVIRADKPIENEKELEKWQSLS